MATNTKSGIAGYVYTKTSLTLKFTSGDVYRYDVSEVLTQKLLNDMVKLAKAGSGLNGFLNKHPQVRKYGYLDTTLGKGSFKPY